MKLTAIILLTAAMQVSASGHAQTITLTAKNASLQKVFAEIEKQSKYNFVYTDDLLQNAKKVDVDIRNGSIEQVLAICFKDQPLTYNIVEKVVVVKQKTISSNEATTEKENLPIPLVNIEGRITDEESNGLFGASVKIRGTNIGTTTDPNGFFKLTNISEDAVTEISFVGFESKIFDVSSLISLLRSNSSLILTLKRTDSPLDAVQVEAYRTNTKRFSTGNISTVKAADIEKQPINNPLLALQGRVPGLVVTQVNGVPGGGVIVQIQGQNSLTNGNDPLYIIDGVPYVSQNLTTTLGGTAGVPILGTSSVNRGTQGNPLSYINTADIESIEILKDADATSIYGSRAANGAILITTKRGKKGHTKADINFQQGFGKVANFIDMLDSRQYMEMRREAKNNDNASVRFSDYDLNGLWDSTRYTDWQKTLIGGTAQYSDYNANVSGGTNNIQYLLGGAYHRETTVFPGDFASRNASAHINLNAISTSQKFRIQFSGTYSSGKSNLPGRDFTRDIFLAPVAPALYNPDGTLNWAPNSDGNSSWSNPLAQLYNIYDNKVSSLVSNAVVSYRILPGLDLKSSFGITSLTSDEFVANTTTAMRPENRTTDEKFAEFSFNNIRSWIVEPQLTYQENFAGGKIDILLGGSIQQQENDGNSIRASGQPNDLLLKSLSAATLLTPILVEASTYKYNGGFGRISYNWGNKYLVNLTARRDGSSRFGEKNQFHNFGSVGLGWVFSEIKLVKQKLPFLSFGKIRGSYGTTGSDQIRNYAYLNTFSPTSYGNPYQGGAAINVRGLSNPYLQWEETRKLQTGIDLTLFKDKLLITTNYVQNRSSNQLVSYSLPSTAGFESIVVNFPAHVQNTLWEFALTVENIRKKEFAWSISANLTLPQNKLLEYPDLSKSSHNNVLVIGEPISIAKTFKFYGVNPQEGTYLVYDRNGNPTSTPDLIADRYVIFNTAPTLYGGIQNNLRIRGLQIDFFLQFTKQKNYNLPGGDTDPGNFNRGLGNQPKTVLDRWRNPGDITNVQRYTSDFRLADFVAGDRTLEDLSFYRLKNVSISYDFNKNLLKRIQVQNLKIFVTAQNLFTITSYKGLDPENRIVSSLPPLRVITAGARLTL